MNYQCIISGKVQRVYYRSYIQDMASSASFDGYVRNLPNGNVEACISLKKEQKLEQFLEILKAGSPYSRVDHIETRSIAEKFSSGFKIRK
jgi:acylphosphatase